MSTAEKVERVAETEDSFGLNRSLEVSGCPNQPGIIAAHSR